MPEGPTILLLAGQLQRFVGRKVLRATGNAPIDLARLRGQVLRRAITWGKHLLLCFDGCTVRVHFLLFGRWRIDERGNGQVKLGLGFAGGGELNTYAASVQLLEGPPEDHYDWSRDVLSPGFDLAAARARLRAAPARLACDALLDQDAFAGVGNIIKNEVLFRVRVHPAAQVGAIPARAQAALVREARDFAFEFLEGKRTGTLDARLQVHGREHCPRDGGEIVQQELGQAHRNAHFCPACQRMFSLDPTDGGGRRPPARRGRAVR